MSTKNLARTVIEGGRSRYNQYERRHSHRDVRCEERVFARDARLDPERDEDRVWPSRDPVRRGFHDKLSPAERWMRSQVGRPWNRVRAELFALFDTRTLAGRHIVFDHMLPSRWDRGDSWNIQRCSFRVDAHGLLRLASPPYRYRRPTNDEVAPSERHEICALAGDRRVITRGTHVYWLVPVVFEPSAGTRYRQDRELTTAERARWLAFSAAARALVELLPSPVVD